MRMAVKVGLKSANQILKDHGLEKDGPIQRYWTSIVNKRLTKYMPFKSGALSTKLKLQLGQSKIMILGPYARYQYEGKAMVNAKTGKGPSLIPGVGYRYKKGSVLKATVRPLKYDTTKNPYAGPQWDKRLVEREGASMVDDLKKYVRHREGKA